MRRRPRARPDRSDALEHRRHGARDVVAMARRDRAEPLHAVEERRQIALQQREDALAQLAAQRGIEAPRQPEVDEQQARVRRRAGLVDDEQVSRVGVGVEQAVGEHLGAVGAREDREHRARLDAEPREPRAVVDRDRGVVAHREHAARRVARDHLGHQHRRDRRRGSRRSRRRRAPRARSRALRAARCRTRGTARRRRRCRGARCPSRAASARSADPPRATPRATDTAPSPPRARRPAGARGAPARSTRRRAAARRTRRTRARAGCRARSPPRRGSARTAAAARGRAAPRARR